MGLCRGQWNVGISDRVGGLGATLFPKTIGHLASRTLQLKFCDLFIEEENLSSSENKRNPRKSGANAALIPRSKEFSLLMQTKVISSAKKFMR